MKNEIFPMFRRGDIGDGIKRFLELLELAETLKELGWSPTATDPVENWLPFAHDQPFVLEWCPSESDVQRLTHPTLLLEGDQTTPLIRDICRLLTEKLHADAVVENRRWRKQPSRLFDQSPDSKAEGPACTLHHERSDDWRKKMVNLLA
jgi:hypothetical protein